MENKSEKELSKLFEELIAGNGKHSPDSVEYKSWAGLAAENVEILFGKNADSSRSVSLNPFGEVQFPFYRMGNITSVNLFGLDELILFCFYSANRARYSASVDIGANIGLHSLVMARCGMGVRSYEPDPVHAEKLLENMKLNGVEDAVDLQVAAVSSKSGQAEFVRVLGNTTGSHLKGAKQNPYGELETFPVRVASVSEAIRGVNLMKLDAEGEESRILLALNLEEWENLDAVVEVGSPENAELIYNHFKETWVNLFAQKNSWAKVEDREQMPESYKDGSLFISKLDFMPWGERK